MAWEVVEGPIRVDPRDGGDHTRFRMIWARGDERREVFIEISGTALSTAPEALSPEIAEAVRTSGESVLPPYLSRAVAPDTIEVSSNALVVVPRGGEYEHGDRVYVQNEDGKWQEARFLESGDPADARTVEDPRVVGGSRPADIAWVEDWTGDHVRGVRYADIRPRPPR